MILAVLAFLATLIGSAVLLAVSNSTSAAFIAFALLLGSIAGLLIALDRRWAK